MLNLLESSLRRVLMSVAFLPIVASEAWPETLSFDPSLEPLPEFLTLI